jgi:hypothetical protein
MMNRRTQGEPLGPKDRIAAFARAAEAHAETLEDPDLANVYFGKSLGLWQAAAILSAEDQAAPSKRLRGPSPTCGPRRAAQEAARVLAAGDLNTTGAGYLTRGWESILIPLAEPASSGSAGERGLPTRRRSPRPASKTA